MNENIIGWNPYRFYTPTPTVWDALEILFYSNKEIVKRVEEDSEEGISLLENHFVIDRKDAELLFEAAIKMWCKNESNRKESARHSG